MGKKTIVIIGSGAGDLALMRVKEMAEKEEVIIITPEEAKAKGFDVPIQTLEIPTYEIKDYGLKDLGALDYFEETKFKAPKKNWKRKLKKNKRK